MQDQAHFRAVKINKTTTKQQYKNRNIIISCFKTKTNQQFQYCFILMWHIYAMLV